MKVDIRLSGPTQGEVFIDGNKIKNVTSVKFDFSVLDCPVVVLGLIPDEVNIEADNVLVFKEKPLEECSFDELTNAIITKFKEEVKSQIKGGIGYGR